MPRGWPTRRKSRKRTEAAHLQEIGMQLWAFIAFVVSVLVVVYLGYLGWKRTKSASDYMLAGRAGQHAHGVPGDRLPALIVVSSVTKSPSEKLLVEIF
jgi:choline-glycine betaine transporter